MEEAKLAKKSGRDIHRLVTLCGTITQLVAEHDRRLLASDPDADDGDDNDDNLSPEAKEEVAR